MEYDRNTGKPIDKRYLELNLPTYLQHDLDMYKKGLKDKVSYLDCLWCELYDSINCAEVDDEIHIEQAQYLRDKYLYSDKEEDSYD